MTDKPAPKLEDIELHPDAWERFEEFVKRIARAGPQPRAPKKTRETQLRSRGDRDKDDRNKK